MAIGKQHVGLPAALNTGIVFAGSAPTHLAVARAATAGSIPQLHLRVGFNLPRSGTRSERSKDVPGYSSRAGGHGRCGRFGGGAPVRGCARVSDCRDRSGRFSRRARAGLRAG